uniref:Uncharacterized protein n=1 Tax=Vitis vinifera TaxID=29760 RepID=A5C6C0_VITVI|nr:hypothetical protein VITISV_031484 [Vitis vinifera]
MMRRFNGQNELLRPTKTQFATAFITLSRLHEQRNNLKKTFRICQIVSGPLVRGLRLIDGEKKAPMGYIYEAMNRAKDMIVNCFTKLLISILQLNGGLHMELQLQICKDEDEDGNMVDSADEEDGEDYKCDDGNDDDDDDFVDLEEE